MPFLSVAAIEGAIAHLASAYAQCIRFTLPHASRQGRPIRALRIRGSPFCERPGILLLGGTHANELMNPDVLVFFASRVLRAYRHFDEVSFGARTYSRFDVRRVVDGCDLFLVPLVNPDGRLYVQDPDGDPTWRKNRAPNDGACAGVDLNRNSDFLWDSGIASYSDACEWMYRGPAAFSEPEARNVRRLLDRHSHISLLCDVHSYSELVMHNWADDEVQTRDPQQNFRNPSFDGDRGEQGSGYREFIPRSELEEQRDLARAVAQAIESVRGRSYEFGAWGNVLFYTAAGTFQDYAYSLHFVESGRGKVIGMTLETGREFQPERDEARQVIREVSAGLFELCLARAGDPVCIPGFDDLWDYLWGPADEEDADWAGLLAPVDSWLMASAARIAADEELAGRWRRLGTTLRARDAARDDLDSELQELVRETAGADPQLAGGKHLFASLLERRRDRPVSGPEDLRT